VASVFCRDAGAGLPFLLARPTCRDAMPEKAARCNREHKPCEIRSALTEAVVTSPTLPVPLHCSKTIAFVNQDISSTKS
jgi:hypothetical protein